MLECNQESLYPVAAFIDFVAKPPGQLFKLHPEIHPEHEERTQTLLHRKRDVRGRSKNDSRISPIIHSQNSTDAS